MTVNPRFADLGKQKRVLLILGSYQKLKGYTEGTPDVPCEDKEWVVTKNMTACLKTKGTYKASDFSLSGRSCKYAEAHHAWHGSVWSMVIWEQACIMELPKNKGADPPLCTLVFPHYGKRGQPTVHRLWNGTFSLSFSPAPSLPPLSPRTSAEGMHVWDVFPNQGICRSSVKRFLCRATAACVCLGCPLLVILWAEAQPPPIFLSSAAMLIFCRLCVRTKSSYMQDHFWRVQKSCCCGWNDDIFGKAVSIWLHLDLKPERLQLLRSNKRATLLFKAEQLELGILNLHHTLFSITAMDFSLCERWSTSALSHKQKQHTWKNKQGRNRYNVGLVFLAYSVSPVAELSSNSTLLSVACNEAGHKEKNVGKQQECFHVCQLYP